MKNNRYYKFQAKVILGLIASILCLSLTTSSLAAQAGSPVPPIKPVPSLDTLSKGQLRIQERMYELLDDWYNISYVRNSEPPKTDRSDPYLNTRPGFACRETEINAADDVQSFPLFSSVPPNVFPGSIIKGNTLLTSTYGVISGPRNSAKIVIDAPWITKEIGTETMSPISHAQYLEAYRRLLRAGITDVPANISFQIERIFSESQLNFMLQANVSGSTFKVSTQFKIDSTDTKQYALISVDQKFFRMYLDRPAYGAELFARDLTDKDVDFILKEITATNPPLYISAIDYGRKAYILFESSDKALDIQATLAAGYKGTVEVDGKVDVKVREALQSMSAKGFVIGGSTELGSNSLEELFSGSATNGMDALKGVRKWLTEGSSPSEKNPPAALGYEFSLLLDGTKALARTVTEYKETDCNVGVCPSGFYWGKKYLSNWFSISPEQDPKIAPAAGLIGEVIEIQDGSFYTYELARCNRIAWENVALECVPNQRRDFQPGVSPPGIWTWHEMTDKDNKPLKRQIWVDYWCDDDNYQQRNIQAYRLTSSDGAPPVPLEDKKDEGLAADPPIYWRWK